MGRTIKNINQGKQFVNVTITNSLPVRALASTKTLCNNIRPWFLLIIHLFLSIITYGQRTVNVIVPKDDASPFNWPTKYLWLGRVNPIASDCVGEFQILKVWTDNGTIDTGNYYLTNYAITPVKSGTVNVYSLQRVWNGESYDTIQTKNTFNAILQPKIIVKLKSDLNNKGSVIRFDLIDSLTNRPIKRRYRIGRFYDPEVFDNNGTLIGTLSMCHARQINLNDPLHNVNQIKFEKGYKIKFVITLRDMQTDLLILTDEFEYILKKI